MNVEKKREEVVTVKETVVITLTPGEAKILRALADFPHWDKQPGVSGKFCENLCAELDRRGFFTAAGNHFNKYTSLD